MGLIFLTGFLVNQSPVAASVPPAPASVAISGSLGTARLSGTLTPGQPGPNKLVFVVEDHHGMPLELLTEPEVAWSLPAADSGHCGLRRHRLANREPIRRTSVFPSRASGASA